METQAVLLVQLWELIVQNCESSWLLQVSLNFCIDTAVPETAHSTTGDSNEACHRISLCHDYALLLIR